MTISKEALDKICDELSDAQEEYVKVAHRIAKEALDARQKFAAALTRAENAIEANGGPEVELSIGEFRIAFEDIGDLTIMVRSAVDPTIGDLDFDEDDEEFYDDEDD